jgi:hypothetical protein
MQGSFRCQYNITVAADDELDLKLIHIHEKQTIFFSRHVKDEHI